MTALGDDYIGFCEGLRKMTGIDLLQYKRPQMERRLRAFFERQGIKRLTDCLPRLKANDAELAALLDRMTINVSQLWRNPEQWQMLANEVLPELGAGGRLRAWSAGCSYGAESYTLAALCKESIPAVQAQILGTDIDRRMVERARVGFFSDDDARSAPPASMKRWFEHGDGGWQARRELQQLVRFETGDLLRTQPRAGHFDLVMCRNTVIYFAEPIRDELHGRLARSLRPGGYLMVGATERVSDAAGLGLQSIHPFIFRKA